MRAKPVVPRASARQDAEEAIDHDLGQGARDVALGFVEALEQASPPAGMPNPLKDASDSAPLPLRGEQICAQR